MFLEALIFVTIALPSMALFLLVFLVMPILGISTLYGAIGYGIFKLIKGGIRCLKQE